MKKYRLHRFTWNRRTYMTTDKKVRDNFYEWLGNEGFYNMPDDGLEISWSVPGIEFAPSYLQLY